MGKFLQIVLVVGLIAVAASEPPRRFNARLQNRNRFFARQEIAPNSAPSVTPYPPAGEKPDIPFELPNQEAAAFPDPTYGPPDQTYGPPDQVYGPPLPEEALPEPEPEDYDEQATNEPEAERLVFVSRHPGQSSRLVLRKSQRTRSQGAAQLRRPVTFAKSAKLIQPVTHLRQNIVTHPILLKDGTLLYSIYV